MCNPVYYVKPQLRALIADEASIPASDHIRPPGAGCGSHHSLLAVGSQLSKHVAVLTSDAGPQLFVISGRCSALGRA